jgi:hypothetical protein
MLAYRNKKNRAAQDNFLQDDTGLIFGLRRVSRRGLTGNRVYDKQPRWLETKLLQRIYDVAFCGTVGIF